MPNYCYPQPRPAVTVDAVCLAPGDGRLHVLLIERGHEPYRGCWAFPGGFVDQNESLETAVARELNEETGLAGLPARQFRAYGDPGRDPRGHTVTVVFLVTCASCFPVRGQDDAARAEWFPLDALPPLAFDHSRILADVQSYLAGVGWPARPSLDDRVHRTEQNPRSR